MTETVKDYGASHLLLMINDIILGTYKHEPLQTQ